MVNKEDHKTLDALSEITIMTGKAIRKIDNHNEADLIRLARALELNAYTLRKIAKDAS